MTHKALVIDDDISIRVTTKHFFNNRGFEVLEAENGAQGLAKLVTHQRHIGLITLDLIMPEVDGFSFLSTVDELKKTGALTNVPRIIVLTVINNFDELKRLTKFECLHAVLKKPFNPAELEVYLPFHQAAMSFSR